MAKQTFATGAELKSSTGVPNLTDLQKNDYNWTVSTKTASYVLVAADVGTRIAMNVATANTVTVNTALFAAGDVLVIQNINTGVVTVTAGTATVSGAGGLTLAQYQEGWLYFVSAGVAIFFKSASGGLVRVGGGTLSGTATTIIAGFSTLYNSYLVDVSNLQMSAVNTVKIELDLSGTPSTTGYTRITTLNNGTTVSGSIDTTLWDIFIVTTATGQGFQFTLINPALATPTKLVSSSFDLNVPRSRHDIGTHSVATAYNQLKFSSGGAETFTTGVVNVYGLALS